MAIENFLRLNRESLSASTEGNLRNKVRDLRAELVNLKAQIQVLNRAIKNQGSLNQGGLEYGRMRILEPHSYGGARDVKELKISCLIWNNTSVL